MLPQSLPQAKNFTAHGGEPSLRWGMLGTGWVAGYFSGSMREHSAQRMTAVASRTLARAEEFAAQGGIDKAYGSYESLIDDPDIDVVYIALEQSEHLPWGLRAIAAGKHVLIEKPLATTASDAQTLVDAARAAGVMMMEAMWSRYHPHTLAIRELIAEGVIGDVRSVTADHGQAIAADPNHRLLRPGTGGGALLDLGIYPVQLDSMVLGAPSSITAIGALTESGVDAYSTLVLGHAGAEQSTLMTSIVTHTPTVAAISGTLARVEMTGPFHIPNGFRVATPDLFAPTLTWEDTTGVGILGGFSWEATAFATFVGEGRLESPLHAHEETVSILATIDEARRQLGAR